MDLPVCPWVPVDVRVVSWSTDRFWGGRSSSVATLRKLPLTAYFPQECLFHSLTRGPSNLSPPGPLWASSVLVRPPFPRPWAARVAPVVFLGLSLSRTLSQASAPPWAHLPEPSLRSSLSPSSLSALSWLLPVACLSVPASLLFWHWFFLCSAFLCLFLLPSSVFYSLIFSFYSFFIFSIYILFFFFFFLRGRRFYRLYCLWPNQTPALSSLSHCLVTLCWWCLVTKSYPALLRP